MAETVSLRIKIDDGGDFKKVSVDVDDLNNAIKHATAQVKDFNKEVINWAQAAQASDLFASAMGELSGMVSELTSGYMDDHVELAKLSQAMRNTMSATDDMIGSVENLIDAQESLGVVEKGAQLAGAQELSTYLELSSSLEELIPVMNDMAAQQLGVGASAESVAQIASMLGKVMNGQTEALSRYGYKFDEAQKQILQFGTESERAAVLAEVVSQSVGGMNEALRQTDAGALFGARIVLENLKDAAGQVLSKISPLIDGLASLGETAGGLLKLSTSMKSLSEMMGLASVKSLALAGHQKIQAAAQNILAAAGYTAAAGTTALRIATAALYATLTMGLSVAITAIVSLVQKLAGSSSDAAQGVSELDEASEAFKRTSTDLRAELAMETINLERLIKGKKDTSEAIKNLNAKYGEAFGYHKTASEWYDTLVAKSSIYCQQLGYEAQAKVLASQKAAKELELEEVRRQRKEMAPNATENGFYLARNDKCEVAGWGLGEHYSKEFLELLQKEKEIQEQTQSLGKSFDTCMKKAAEAAQEMGNTVVSSAPESSGGSDDSSKIEGDIEAYRQAVERAVQTNQVFVSSKSDEEVALNAMKSGITSLISKYGAENEAVQGLITEYYKLKRARAESTIMAEPLENLSIPALSSKATALSDGSLAGAKRQQQVDISVKGVDKVEGATKSLSALSNVMNSLSGAVGEGAAKWLSWGANVVNAIAQAIPSIAGLITAKNAESTANTAAMATGAGSSVASIPFVGPVLAVAAIASVLAAVANLPKFADGGIAYGPTLGLFAEYAGADNNPEVVAPLSKLKSMLDDGDSTVSSVQFKIKAGDLVGVLEGHNKKRRRG